MEPIHIFYKELPGDENNIFTAKNELQNVKFKKSLEYAVTGLSINQDIGSALMTVTDTNRLLQVWLLIWKLNWDLYY